MKRTTLFYNLLPFIVMAIPWIYLLIIWNDLPAVIPTHFGLNGIPDDFGKKQELFLILGIMSGIGIAIYFLMRNIHRIDPKKRNIEAARRVLSKMAIALTLLLCAVSLFILYWTLQGGINGMGVFFCGISLLIAYTGNLMHSIKPNYFAGFRLPWTLENEDNWRKTHQLASKIWFTGGIVLAVVSLLVSMQAMIIIFIAVMLVMAIIPGWYSYALYKRSLK